MVSGAELIHESALVCLNSGSVVGLPARLAAGAATMRLKASVAALPSTRPRKRGILDRGEDLVHPRLEMIGGRAGDGRGRWAQHEQADHEAPRNQVMPHAFSSV